MVMTKYIGMDTFRVMNKSDEERVDRIIKTCFDKLRLERVVKDNSDKKFYIQCPHVYHILKKWDIHEKVYKTSTEVKDDFKNRTIFDDTHIKKNESEYVSEVEYLPEDERFLAELAFLSDIAEKTHVNPHVSFLVIYDGAAPGYHIPELFQQLGSRFYFLLSDLAFYDKVNTAHLEDLVSKRRCKIYADDESNTGGFTEDMEGCKEYFGFNKNDSNVLDVIYISNRWVHYPDHNEVNNLTINFTRSWKAIKSVKPFASMIRLDLPRNSSSIDLLPGFLQLPVFGPIEGSKTRLCSYYPEVPSKRSENDFRLTAEYRYADYHATMRAFNRGVRRTKLYDVLKQARPLLENQLKNFPDAENLTHIYCCHDCAREVQIKAHILAKQHKNLRLPWVIASWNPATKATEITQRRIIRFKIGMHGYI